jgi:hypothetical protein
MKINQSFRIIYTWHENQSVRMMHPWHENQSVRMNIIVQVSHAKSCSRYKEKRHAKLKR